MASRDEKDLDQNGYVDVQHIIKSSSVEQEQKSEVEAISELLTNQFSDDVIKPDDVYVPEPDSTTSIEEKKNLTAEITNLMNKFAEQERQVETEKVIEKPITITKEAVKGSCKYCDCCK